MVSKGQERNKRLTFAEPEDIFALYPRVLNGFIPIEPPLLDPVFVSSL
jgi:hypothetical protein